MAFRSSSQAVGAASASVSTNVPAGIANNDIAILIISFDYNEAASGAATFTFPTGFTEIVHVSNGAPDGNTVAIAWKRCDGTESGTFTVTVSAGGQSGNAKGLICGLWSGRHTTNPPVAGTWTDDTNGGSGFSSPMTSTAVSVTAVAGDDIAYISSPDTNNAPVGTGFTVPSGYTVREDQLNAEDWVNGELATKDNVSVGATGTVAGDFAFSGGGVASKNVGLVRIPAAAGGSVAAAAGMGTAAGVGASTAASVGAAAGTGTATGVGAATAASVGAAAGIGAAPGVGASTAASVGAAAGIGAAPGVGAGTAASVGAAAGIGAAPGVGADASASGSIGAASGAGTATGVGASVAAAVGTASGTSDAPGVGASTAASAGAAAGLGDAPGVGRDGSTPASAGYAMALGGEDAFYQWWRRQKKAIEQPASATEEVDRVEPSPVAREAIRDVPTAILQKIDKAATSYDVRVIASGLGRVEAGIVEAVARAADEEAARRQEEEDVASVFLSLI